MQISTRERDYIIDTIELRHKLHILNEVFTDPKIVKVTDANISSQPKQSVKSARVLGGLEKLLKFRCKDGVFKAFCTMFYY